MSSQWVSKPLLVLLTALQRPTWAVRAGDEYFGVQKVELLGVFLEVALESLGTPW
jgi:hypothetical protein